MKRMKSKEAVSLLLSAALILTTGAGGDAAWAAKKQTVKVSSVKITNSGKKLRLQKGKKFRLSTSVNVKPNKSKYKKLKFTSSNPKIVLVNSKGLLKGVKEGTAKVTAASKTNPQKKAVVTVSVTKDTLVTSIKLNKTKITVDEFNQEEIQLKVKKILPADAKNKKVKWSTSDDNVADVDDDGVVTTGDAGDAVIKAEAADQGGAYATCKVVVLEKEDNSDDEDEGKEKEDKEATQVPVVSVRPPEAERPTETEKPVETEGAAETEKPAETPQPTIAPTIVPSKPATLAPTRKPEKTPKPTVPPTPTTDPTLVPTQEPTMVPTKAPTLKPTRPPRPKPTMPPSAQDYEYFSDYTLGCSNGEIVAYQDGMQMPLSDAGADVYNKETDNIFAQHIANNEWDAEKIILTPPIQYTTSDGVAHNVGSMLTNWNFCSEPTAIDNSDVDGKLYVYGKTDSIDYEDGTVRKENYANHSLTIMSTKDMVNWTDEGFMDNNNLTNKPEFSSAKQASDWATWASGPSGLKIDVDRDGKDEYYLFYTSGGTGIGYVQGDSPTGPWHDLNTGSDGKGEALVTKNTPNCADVNMLYDPAVLVDDRGDAYLYFGGGYQGGKEAHPKTGRVVRIMFDPETKRVELYGDPQELDAFYMFEDSEINQFHGKYFYSYHTNFAVPASGEADGALNPVCSDGIACYVSDDPMNITFDPETQESTDSLKYLGSIMGNPGSIYGHRYYNTHRMQSFKGHDYMFYQSTVLSNILFRDLVCYNNLHVDEITVDEDTDAITVEPSYEGASQIEDFEPYQNEDGSVKYINATTSASSAGVKSSRDDVMVWGTINGSPMVLDEIDTGDWTCIKGVDFGKKGLKDFGVEYLSDTNAGRIELFIDSPTESANLAAAIDISETNEKYVFRSVETMQTVIGKHDIYFVFRGSGYKVATWTFSENEDEYIPESTVTPRPTLVPTVPATLAPTIVPSKPATMKPMPTVSPTLVPTLRPSKKPTIPPTIPPVHLKTAVLKYNDQVKSEENPNGGRLEAAGKFNFEDGEGYPESGIDVMRYDRVIIRIAATSEIAGDGSWYGKVALTSSDGDKTDYTGLSAFDDGFHDKAKQLEQIDMKDGMYEVVYEIPDSIDEMMWSPGEVSGFCDAINLCMADSGDYEKLTLKEIVFESDEQPQPTKDPYVPQGEGWQRLDLSKWSGSPENYLETGEQLILSGVQYGTIPIPQSLDNIGDKIEVLIRGSVSEGSNGFRYWLANEDEEWMTEVGNYAFFGEGVGNSSEDLDDAAFKTGDFQVQRVLEHNNSYVSDDIIATKLCLKGPTYNTTMDGVTITGIWVRYGDDIGTD